MALKTVSEIKAFQNKHGLVPDGIVGPQTRKVMAELAAPPSRHARKEPDKAAINTGKAASAPMSPAAPLKRWAGQIAIAATARPVSEIIFHCAATPEGRWYDRNDVNAWHKQRGFTSIGYHYLILLDGTIQVGRPIGQTGAHCENRNVGSIGVSYIGGLSKDGKRPKDTRTPAQIAAAEWLVGALKAKFSIKRRVRGHNEYNAGKACPSFNVAKDRLGAI